MIPIDPFSFGLGVGVAALAVVAKGKGSWRSLFAITDADMVQEAKDEDEKKAPAAATAGTKNFSNKIFNLSVAREERIRKAAK